jgi:hypothetical protein
VRVLVLIPARNEEASLPAVVADVRTHAPDAEILVVDDASTDGTPGVLQDLGVRWLRMPQPLGLGVAVRTGLRYAMSMGCETVVRLDGDGQHPADVIERLLEPLRQGRADVVVGSRYAAEAATTPFLRRFTHRVLAGVLTLLTRQRVTDPTSGLWAFGPAVMPLMVNHHPSGYPEPELIMFLRRNSIRLEEVPVRMRDRLGGRTSLTPQRTSAAMVRLLLLLVVVPLRSAVRSGGGRADA